MAKNFKLISFLILLLILLISIPFLIYLKLLPYAVSNENVINYLENYVKESINVDLVIKKPALKTDISPVIKIKADEISVCKNKEKLLDIKSLDTSVSLREIFDENIILRELIVDYVFADINKLLKLVPQKQTPAPQNWNLEWINATLKLNKCELIYNLSDGTRINVIGKNMGIAKQQNPKYVTFHINANLTKQNKALKLVFDDNNHVYIKNHKLFIDKAPVYINGSKLFIETVADEKNNFALDTYADDFDIQSVVNLLNSNIVIPNGKEMLTFFKDIKGNFDFRFHITNTSLNGKLHVNKAELKVLPLKSLPLTVESGDVIVGTKNIQLRDFRGYYDYRKNSSVKMDGVVNDYTKTCHTEITAKAVATNSFSKKYLTPLIGYPLEIKESAPVKIVFESDYPKMNLKAMFKIKTGNDILADGQSFSPTDYDRAVLAEFHFENNVLDINKINYYIAKTLNKNSKVKPILTVYGKIDLDKIMKTGKGMPDIKKLGFKITDPLPSEFLNVLMGQKVFKRGTIFGHLEYINTDKIPYLAGHLSVKKVRIPSQRLSIKDGEFTTDKKMIHVDAYGRFKKSDYKVKGRIQNQMVLPIIVKDIDLDVDNIDVERMLKSFNNQNTMANSPQLVKVTNPTNDESDDEDFTFNTGLIIVEKCSLNLIKGKYKDINFGNLFADLTLDKNGILQIKSNKFDFAEGHSTLKVYCDLIKHKYFIRLGIKGVNSDLIATTLLQLKKEISGKAYGLIELNTDDSLKLNGKMKFAVKKGTIGKIGLVEYVLKFAALFRNPMAMISPSTLVDLVNVPEGNFDKISGHLEIKDNVIEKINIRSTAPQLSSFIVGRYNIENGDATLRIYTKFSNKNKGLAGAMRNISLNSLANRIPLSNRNDENYYSAELSQLPPIEADEKDCQVFLTKVDGDVEHFNFISSLKKIK